MIKRYSREDMAKIFEDRNKLSLWLQIELAVARAMADLGHIPKESIDRLEADTAVHREAILDVDSVAEIEATTRHDVIAFLTHVESLCGTDTRYLHLGMTSSDLLDTTLALQLTQATDLILNDLKALLEALKQRAFEHRHTVTIGRSHGIHAEPLTFGLKLAGFYAEMDRNRRRLEEARAEIATCAISGAVGTFANIDPEIEAAVAVRLGLTPEPVSTQIIPRDRHAAFTAALGILASGIERIATEIRHLQRTEVGEAEEFFHPGQKGSSAMPHKRNPVLSENLTGLARMIRAAVVPALENVTLWHERDISHSSVERVMLPDACILADFALVRLTGMIEKLVVYPERMLDNLEATHGLVHSQRVLLALVEAGLPRQEAYALVQRQAMRAWEEKTPLQHLLARDPAVSTHLDAATLARLFDLSYHTRHVDRIFERVFG